ncbi:MAG: carotenoid biosynthesis protein [Promethearchaeota archaeon]
MLWSPLPILMFISKTLIPYNYTFIFPVLFVIIILHGVISHGWKATLTFCTFSFLFTTLVEYFGDTAGFLFGNYSYLNNPQLGVKLFGVVPIIIPITWTVLIYSAVNCVKIMLNDQGKKLTWKTSGVSNLKKAYRILMRSIGSAALLGAAVTVWDVAMDPLAVAIGFYEWDNAAAFDYFGIPYSNFFGWWVVAFSVGLVYFIVIEPLMIIPYQEKTSRVSRFFDKAAPLAFRTIPVMIYLTFFLGIFKIALITGLTELIFINIVSMGPLVLITFLKSKNVLNNLSQTNNTPR